MFRSIKTKMLLLVVCTLVMTALILMFFTKRDIEKEMVETEEKSLRNIIYLVQLNIENQYRGFLFHKVSTILKLKKEMRGLASFVTSGIEPFYQMYKKGDINEEQARKLAMDWITEPRQSTSTYFFVYDDRSVVLSHPDSQMVGKDLSDLRDIKEIPLLDSMRERSKKDGDGFAVFSWGHAGEMSESKNLGYFIHYPRWNWMIGAVVSLDDLVLEGQKRVQLILQELKETFSKIKIARSGHLFLFNSKKELLIHPTLPKDALSAMKNSFTGNLLADDLIAASKNPDKPIEYSLEGSPTQKGESLNESYVSYFKTLDWYIATSARQNEIKMPAQAVVMRQMLLISLIFIISIIITYFLVRRISQPLNKLAVYAKELPTHDFTVSKYALSEIERFPVKFKDEVGRLAEAFLFMEDALKQYIKDLQETTATKERFENQIEIAHDIQMDILPRIFPPFPERRELDIYAVLKPALEVGGDFYDFFFVDRNHLFFVVGDVSGKGVPASMFMAMTKTLLKAGARKDTPPDEILTQVNRKLSEDNDACVFVTAFCGILNTNTGELFYANSGHTSPLLVTPGKRAHFIKVPQSIALGVMDGVQYKMEQLVLEPGDFLFLYTDGLAEALSFGENDPSWEKKLQKELGALEEHSPKEMSEALMEKITTASGKEEQSDDITMVVLKFMGRETEATKRNAA